MVMYVDETENDEIFIVAGVLIDSEQTALLSYKRFKKSLRNYPVSSQMKSRLFSEFKSVLLDRGFQVIKRKLLRVISQNCIQIVYAKYEHL